MYGDQYPSGGEFLGWEELGRILDLGADCLLAQGKYMRQGGLTLDEYKGYPVVTRQPSYNLKLSEKEVDELAPDFVEVLDVHGPVEIDYFIPCYLVEEEGEQSFIESSLAINIIKDLEGEVESEGLLILRDDDGRVESDRVMHLRGEDMESLSGI